MQPHRRDAAHGHRQHHLRHRRARPRRRRRRRTRHQRRWDGHRLDGRWPDRRTHHRRGLSQRVGAMRGSTLLQPPGRPRALRGLHRRMRGWGALQRGVVRGLRRGRAHGHRSRRRTSDGRPPGHRCGRHRRGHYRRGHYRQRTPEVSRCAGDLLGVLPRSLGGSRQLRDMQQPLYGWDDVHGRHLPGDRRAGLGRGLHGGDDRLQRVLRDDVERPVPLRWVQSSLHDRRAVRCERLSDPHRRDGRWDRHVCRGGDQLLGVLRDDGDRPVPLRGVQPTLRDR